MAVVSVSINGRLYDIGCDDSQVAEVRRLEGVLDERAQKLAAQVGTQPEGRFLVMLGLLLADELTDARAQLERLAGDVAAVADGDAHLAEAVARMADRIDAIAARLEQA